MEPITFLATQRLDAPYTVQIIKNAESSSCWSALPLLLASPTKDFGTPLMTTVHLNPSPGVVSGNRIVLLSRGQPK